jgi:hypothetical protein
MRLPDAAGKLLTLVTTLLAFAAALTAPAMAAKHKPGRASFPKPVDPQSWVRGASRCRTSRSRTAGGARI